MKFPLQAKFSYILGKIMKENSFAKLMLGIFLLLFREILRNFASVWYVKFQKILRNFEVLSSNFVFRKIPLLYFRDHPSKFPIFSIDIQYAVIVKLLSCKNYRQIFDHWYFHQIAWLYSQVPAFFRNKTCFMLRCYKIVFLIGFSKICALTKCTPNTPDKPVYIVNTVYAMYTAVQYSSSLRNIISSPAALAPYLYT